jgi:hypothetical protein
MILHPRTLLLLNARQHSISRALGRVVRIKRRFRICWGLVEITSEGDRWKRRRRGRLGVNGKPLLSFTSLPAPIAEEAQGHRKYD